MGVDYCRAYIRFCVKNYIYDLNSVNEILFLFKDLLSFFNGRNYIPNRESMSFTEFCKRYYIPQ